MTEHTEQGRHTSALGVVGWFVLLVVVAGGMWQLYKEITAMRATGQPTVVAELKAQEQTIAELKAAIEQSKLAENTTPAPEAPNTELQDIHTQLTAISDRLNTLTTTKPQTSSTNLVPVRLLLVLQNKLLRGQPYAEELETLALLPEIKGEADALTALRHFAAQGAPTDLNLRAGFNDVFAKQPAPAESKTIEKINAHFNGLITVKHHTQATVDDLSNLPPDTPIATLAEKISSLPAEAQVPFADWLSTLAARDKALQALTGLQNKLLPIQ